MSDGRYLSNTRINRLALTVSVNTTLTVDSSEFLWVNTGSGNITVTLPSASSAISKRFIIKKITSDVNVVQFSGTVEGVTPGNLTTQYQQIRIYSDGTNWYNV